MAHKKGGMNKKVLNSMTAMADNAPRIMMHLRGKDAKRFLGSKPGSKMSAMIRGVVQSVGLSEFDNNAPTADIKITKITPSKKKA